MEHKIVIRPIQQKDNLAIKNIIKKTLIEFNSDIPGTAFYDTDLNDMYTAYQQERSIYYVALLNNKLVGGCGINKLSKIQPEICELQKMYLLPEARGKGIGKKLLKKSLIFAKENAYQKCYLESFSYMQKAVALYRYFGFKLLEKEMGNTGHTACNTFMILDLNGKPI